METSDNGLKFIGREEGTVLHVYKDTRGIDTVGVGHVLKPEESYPNGITMEQAMELLRQDVKIAENAINTHVKVPLNQDQYDALASFIFNVGGGAFAGSTLLALLNKGDYAGCAQQFLRWCHAGSSTNQVLLGRRQREMALFNTPVAVTPVPQVDPPVVVATSVPTVQPGVPPAVAPQPPTNGGTWGFLNALFDLFKK